MRKILLLSGLLCLLMAAPAQNVGIGTTAPEGILHLKSTNWIKTILENNSGEARGYIGTDNNGTITIGSNAYWNGSAWVYPNGTNAYYLLFHQPNQAFEFRVRPDGGAQSTPMVIKLSGNVGIGTTNPGQRLEVNGAIRIGNSTTATSGTMRYNNNKFEGYNGSDWKSFDQLPPGVLVTSPTAVNASLTNAGYSFVGALPGVKVRTPETVNVAANSWLTAGTLTSPMPAVGMHSAVWTGTHMILWGGADQYPVASGSAPYPVTGNTGRIYDPVLNLWDTLSTVNVPQGRAQHTAVWTGLEMIVWGGRQSNNNGTYTALANGGGCKINGNWNQINSGPSARYNHTAVWTGTEMIVWGGQPNESSVLNTGSRYNLSTWNATNTVNAPVARTGHTAIWTGTEMIIWGGANAAGTTFYNTGARYNPSTNTWTTMSTTGAPSARSGHTAIWTGTEMIVWGGFNSVFLNTGAKYNPVTDTWTSISSGSAPSARHMHSAVWTGTEMIVHGGYDLAAQDNGGRYNPVANVWNSMAAYNASQPLTAIHNSAVWTGQQLVLFGGFEMSGGSSYTACRRYFPAAQSFTEYRESSQQLYLFEKQ